jgi:hypothetical protein
MSLPKKLVLGTTPHRHLLAVLLKGEGREHDKGANKHETWQLIMLSY